MDEGFSLEDLNQISNILATLQAHCPELLKGLKRIIYDQKYLEREGITAEYKQNVFLGDKITLGDNFLPSKFYHELVGHCVDAHYYGFRKFKELYRLSDKGDSRDFAYDYGMTSHQEDFACTVELYSISSPTQLRRAVYNLKNYGSWIYLEKLIDIIDVFTMGHPGYTVMFDNIYNDAPVLEKNIRHIVVGRDSQGKIISIDGISIYNPDGTYNIENLEALADNILKLFGYSSMSSFYGAPSLLSLNMLNSVQASKSSI